MEILETASAVIVAPLPVSSKSSSRPVPDDKRRRRRLHPALQVVSAVSNLLENTPLEKAMHDNLLRLGPPPFRP
jgi:hypothetical protein